MIEPSSFLSSFAAAIVSFDSLFVPSGEKYKYEARDIFM